MGFSDAVIAAALQTDEQTIRQYRKELGIVRSAFLIDAQGTIEQAWYKISPADTPKKLLEALGR